ncbi:MAG: O-antigen ligase family protein [Chloroflexota bacterium]
MLQTITQLRRTAYPETTRQALFIWMILFACLLIPFNLPGYVFLMIGAIIPTILVSFQIKDNMGASIALVVPLCILVNYDIETATLTKVGLPLVLLTLLVGIWLANMVVFERKLSFVPSAAITPLLLFAATTVFAFLIGQLRWFHLPAAPLAAQLGGVTIFILSFFAFILVANKMDTVWFQRMVWLYIITGGIYVCVRTHEIWTIVDTFFHAKARGSLFWLWLTAMCMGQLLFNRKLTWPIKAGLIAVVGYVFYLTFINNYEWKSGWIPVFVVLFVIIGLRWQALLTKYLPVILPVVVVTLVYTTPYIIATDQYSFLTRIEAWQIMWEIIQYNPFTGLGPANYHWYTPLFPIRGFDVRFSSHNQLLDIVAQTGIVGLVCYLWFFVALFRIGWRLRNHVEEGFPQAYFYGLLAGTVGMLVASIFSDWVLPFVYNIGLEGLRTTLPIWMLMGGVVLYEQGLKDEK